MAVCSAAPSVVAQTIIWNCDANSINQTSSGQVMDGSFRFELGVFVGSFTPTSMNKAEWAANWKPARRTAYDPMTKRYASNFTPQDNLSPFVVGKAAYVWGFRGDALSGEWILFRSASWLWPDADPPVPPPANAYEWFAQNATIVAGVGTINANGSPFLMKSAAVTNAAPPSTSYTQWQADHLAGEPLSAPGDDPDLDGSSNLLEFIFNTLPKSPGPPTATPIERVGEFLQITLPRRIDRAAILMVETSSDLEIWNSGPLATEDVSIGLAGWVVRDLTPLSPLQAGRFMRLKAEVTTP